MVGFLILESLLISSSITKIISDFTIKSGYLDKIAIFPANKLIDYLSFPMFILLAFVIFLIGYLSNIKKVKGKPSKSDILFEVAYLFCYLIIFLQAYFVFSSGKNLLFLIFIVYLSRLVFKKITVKKTFFKFKPRILLNGIIMGFFLSILSSNLTKLTAVPLCLAVVTPFLYLYIQPQLNSILSNPLHLLFVSSVFFPTNAQFLSVLAVLIAVLMVVSQKYIDTQKLDGRIIDFLYTACLIFIFTYNPLFYIGHFDSVEEGFWLAWIERLSSGQIPYRDFFVFHPPAITQGAHYFFKLFGYSIYNLRLYMHLLQVAGYLFIYLLINFFVKSKLNKILAFIIIMIITHTYVRNNTVIRLGSGLIALLPLFIYFKSGNLKLLFASGILSALSFFISSEVGLSTLLTLSVASVIIFAKDPKNIRKIVYPFLGVAIGGFPFVSGLILQGSTVDFVKQIYYYSTSFSAVYASAIERATREPMFIWQKIDSFIGSVGWYWEVTKFSIAATFLAFIYKLVRNNIDYLSKSSAVLGLFGSILAVLFLGRSDYYHLLFVLIVSIILLIYLLEGISKRFVLFDKIFLVVFLLYFLRGTAQGDFIQDNLNKFQAYANPLGNYARLDLDRGGIYVTDVSYTVDMKRLISYLDENLGKDEKIFVYPWSPEIYFLSRKKNATAFDTPLATFSNQYQELMVKQLSENKPKYVVYNPEIKFLNLSVDSLPLVNDYLLDHYQNEVDIGNFQVLSSK